MRTTVTLDDDVAALIEAERQRTGETFKQAMNRLLRRSLHRGRNVEPAPELPLFPGRPAVDITDVSAVLGALEDEWIEEKGLY